jgi:hypothetical protein
MKTSWTGLPGVSFEDSVMGVAAGPICDRTKEHLVSADAAIVRVRRLLLECADLVAAGKDAIGADYQDCTKFAAFDQVLRPGECWQDLVPQHRLPASRETVDASSRT